MITCSGGSGTATINITNNESSTVYYKVEYQIDSGSFTTASANLSIAGGAPDTSVTASVANGSTITWRITDSFTSETLQICLRKHKQQVRLLTVL